MTGIVLGILVGWLAPTAGIALEPIGTTFVNAMRMLIGPIVFLTIVGGIASVADLKKVGMTGLKALTYFQIGTIFALLFGLVAINIFRLGEGVNADASTIKTTDSAAKLIETGAHQEWWQFLTHIIPTSIAAPFVEGDILQIIFIAVIFGIALNAMGKVGAPVLDGVQRLTGVMFKILGFIMKAAPLGAFGAMAFAVGKYGVSSLSSMGGLIALFYATSILFVVVVLGSVMAFLKLNIFKMIRHLKEEYLLILGTSTAEPALPGLMRKLEHAGVKKETVGLVVPTGYSFNLDGAAIYLSLAAVYIAQATNTELTIGQQLGLIAVMLLTSKGAAGVAGGGFIALTATLATIGTIPAAGIMLIFGIDKFMSECRALVNFTGNAVATLFIAWWDRTLDADRVRRVFNGEAVEPLPSEDPTPLDEFTDIAADLTEHHHTPPGNRRRARSTGRRRHRRPAMTAAPPTRKASDMLTTTAPKSVRALIAPDKFKGSLTAGEVADALAAGLRSATGVTGSAGTIHCELLPLADGGDGSVDAAVASGFSPAQLHRRRTHRPARPGQHRVRRRHRRRRGGQHLRPRAPAGRNAGAAGCLQPRLRRSGPVRPQPETGQDRAGPGRQRQHRRRHGHAHRPRLQLPRRRRPAALRQRRGAGADSHHRSGPHLPELADTELIVASDVHNPLLGAQGAPAVFGPQKGAGPEEIAALDRGPRTFRRQADGGGIRRCGPAGWARRRRQRRRNRLRLPAARGQAGLGRRLLPGPAGLQRPQGHLRRRHHRRRQPRRADPGRQAARRRRPAVRIPSDHRRRRPLAAAPGTVVRNGPHPGLHAGRVHRPGLVQGPGTVRRAASPDRKGHRNKPAGASDSPASGGRDGSAVM